MLLRGTGLRVRYVSATAITLASLTDQSRNVLALDIMRVDAAPLLEDSRRFSAYGEALQADIVQAFRRHPRTAPDACEVTLRVWLTAAGASRPAVLIPPTRDA